MNESTRAELLKALKELMPEGWGDDNTMDHMPGVRNARLAIAKAEEEQMKQSAHIARIELEVSLPHVIDRLTDELAPWTILRMVASSYANYGESVIQDDPADKTCKLILDCADACEALETKVVGGARQTV